MTTTVEHDFPKGQAELEEYGAMLFADDLRHGCDELVEELNLADQTAEQLIAQTPSSEVGILRRAAYSLIGAETAFAHLGENGEGEVLKRALTEAVRTRHLGIRPSEAALNVVSLLAQRSDNAKLVANAVASPASGANQPPVERLAINLAAARGILGREAEAIAVIPDAQLLSRIAPFAAVAGISSELPVSAARARAIEYLMQQLMHLAIDLETIRRTADVQPLLKLPTFDSEKGWTIDAKIPFGFLEAQKRAMSIQQARRQAAAKELRAIRARLESDPAQRASVIGRAVRAGWDPSSVPARTYTAGNGRAYLDMTDRAIAATYFLRAQQGQSGQ